MRYRAVLFDLGNTLVSYYHLSEFSPILDRCLKRCCQALGMEAVGNDYAAAHCQLYF
jgi:FMN phosphatase YigB (HAD superfamily)